MPTSKKPSTTKKKSAVQRRTVTPKAPVRTLWHKRLPSLRRIGAWFVYPFTKTYRTLKNNRQQSSHKSFLRTRQRDKIRTPKIEGYIAFPWYVFRMLWNHKWVYVRFLAVFVVLSIIMIGAIQMSNVGTVNDLVSSATSGNSVVNPLMRAFVTVGSALGGALNNNITDVQYLYMSALYILVLLTIVWLLRQQLAGRKVVVRDGLYNAAAPIAAEYVLVGVGILQLIPAALATLVYISATASGILDGGIESAMFSIALFFIVVLTLYFMTTTLFAMFIATIPGTYPLRAYQAARRIVAGQRRRLLFRLLWMLLIILIGWFLVLVPLVIIVNSFGVGSSIIIPIAVQCMTGASLIYGMAYGYLLYRRMIDEPVDE